MQPVFRLSLPILLLGFALNITACQSTRFNQKIADEDLKSYAYAADQVHVSYAPAAAERLQAFEEKKAADLKKEPEKLSKNPELSLTMTHRLRNSLLQQLDKYPAGVIPKSLYVQISDTNLDELYFYTPYANVKWIEADIYILPEGAGSDQLTPTNLTFHIKADLDDGAGLVGTFTQAVKGDSIGRSIDYTADRIMRELRANHNIFK